MSFLYPQLLWLLLLPATLLLATLVPRARAATLAHPKITRAQLKHSALVIRHSAFPPRPLAAALALACLVAAVARPQGRTISTPTVTEARDVLVAVDVSRSMLADDVAPNRLARAQLLIRDLADELAGERLGLLPFAGTAFLQSPLSADYEIFRTFLDELGPDMIPAGGSNFTALLNTADEAFGPPDADSDSGSLLPAPGSPLTPPPADRYLVILSDGEAQDETWKPVAQKLAKRGVRVLALGLGTASGAMVPDGKGGLVKDERGAAVLSRLDASTLRELSRVTDGAYRDASAWVDLPALLKETVARGRGSRDTLDTAPRREELFTWFLAPALALLLVSLVREFPVFPRPRRVSAPPLPPRAATTALALLVSLHWSFVIGHSSFAAEEAAASDPLAELVGQLASADALSGFDLARLATLTADRGEQARAEKKDLPEGALRDALAAVSQGQITAPGAADWPALRQRLDTLLAPPPKPPEQPEQPKNEDQKSEDQPKDPKDSKGQQSSNSKDGSGSPDKSDSKSSPDSQPGDPSESKGSPGQQSSSDPTKPPSSSEALGDLADKSNDEKKPADSPAASQSEQTPPPDPAETQQAGGVSASGQPDGDTNSSATTAQMDPALAVPQQRLERVRDSDAPARLYQLMQDAELPPDSPARAAGKKQDW
ncbi:MAG: VWA domain-containing protein [Burkholderiales bacterium]|nr:VWA domain-containing protein [Opitutaceae bacterium]